jgi:hypothetical protein
MNKLGFRYVEVHINGMEDTLVNKLMEHLRGFKYVGKLRLKI